MINKHKISLNLRNNYRLRRLFFALYTFLKKLDKFEKKERIERQFTAFFDFKAQDPRLRGGSYMSSSPEDKSVFSLSWFIDAVYKQDS